MLRLQTRMATHLHWAAINRHGDVVKYFIVKGTDVKVADKDGNSSVLGY
jgi:ankyrin repeat protein